MKVIYTCYVHQRQSIMLLSSVEEAWKLAFRDLDENRAFPERISVIGEAVYERTEIMLRWQDRNIANPPSTVTVEARQDEPDDASQQIWDRLSEETRSMITRKIVDELPDFLRAHWRKASSAGYRMEDVPTVYHLFREKRDEILKTMEVNGG